MTWPTFATTSTSEVAEKTIGFPCHRRAARTVFKAINGGYLPGSPDSLGVSPFVFAEWRLLKKIMSVRSSYSTD